MMSGSGGQAGTHKSIPRSVALLLFNPGLWSPSCQFGKPTTKVEIQ